MAGLVPLTTACLLAAAQLQGIHPMALITVLKVEGGKVGMESPNRGKDGKVFSHDLGPMQVNDRVWVPGIADMHFGGDRARARAAVRDNGCYNVHVGAWILRQSIDAAGGNVMEGIGYYHSRTPVHKERYKGLFKEKFVQMFGESLGLTPRRR